MFSALLSFISSNLLFLALHLEGNGSFPKPLSEKKETEYFEKFRSGDMSARNTIVEHNMRLVAHIIKKYYNAQTEHEDLLSIGTIGLIKAANTYSSDKKTRFSTYAARCIENEILMHFRATKKSMGDVYINDPIDFDKDGNSLTIIDVMADEGNVVDMIDLKLKSEQIHKLIKEYLSEREAQIIVLRYGLGGKAPLTQREVAAMLNISRSYVSRIEKKILEFLRTKIEP